MAGNSLFPHHLMHSDGTMASVESEIKFPMNTNDPPPIGTFWLQDCQCPPLDAAAQPTHIL